MAALGDQRMDRAGAHPRRRKRAPTTLAMHSTHRRGATRWGLVVGLAATALYLVAVEYTWRLAPSRILYEGEAPPLPYRWVHPPPNLTEDNQPPEPGAGSIALSPEGSQSTSVVTGDGQSGVIFRFGAIAP